jgi:Flp pilus assembly protein TadD
MATKEEMYDEAIRLQQQGDVEGSVGRLQELLQQHSGYALAHAALSVFYSKLENDDQAVEHARTVCELEPEDPFSFVAMSLVCQKAGRLPEAEQALMQARQAQFTAQQNRTD